MSKRKKERKGSYFKEFHSFHQRRHWIGKCSSFFKKCHCLISGKEIYKERRSKEKTKLMQLSPRRMKDMTN